MLPSKRHHSTVKFTYEAEYECNDERSGKRESFGGDNSRKRIKTIQIPSSLKCSDAIVPNSQSQKLSSTPKPVSGNINTPNEPVKKTSTLSLVSASQQEVNPVHNDATTHTNDKHRNDVEPQHNEGVCTAHDDELLKRNDILYDIEEMLKYRVNQEMDKFRTSLSQAITEELSCVSQDPAGAHIQSFQQGSSTFGCVGYADPDQNLQAVAQTHPAQMLPNDELSLANEDWKHYTTSDCLYSNVETVQDDDQLLLKVSDCDIEHQLDHYAMRLLTAALTINASLKST